MDDTLAEIQCEACSKDFEMLASAYEKCIEIEQPILCKDCLEKSIIEQEKLEAPERKKFEYIETDKYDTGTLNLLGFDGWELVQIVNNKAYFKREGL